MTNVSWDDYRLFLALYRSGSIVKAAAAMRIDVTTMRRRLASLEESMEARLVHRRREGTKLTPVGERLVRHVLAIEASTSEIARELAGADQRAQGTVRLSAGEAFMNLLIAPALGSFARRHPRLSVELLVSNQLADLSRGEADTALRLSRPADESLVARKLRTLEFGLFASPGYLEAHGAPASEADLASHRFVGYGAFLEGTPETQWLVERRAPFAMRTTSPLAIYAAADAGVGIAAIARLFAERYPRLRRVLPDAALPSRDLWLVTHRDLVRSAKIRALHGFLTEVLTS